MTISIIFCLIWGWPYWHFETCWIWNVLYNITTNKKGFPKPSRHPGDQWIYRLIIEVDEKSDQMSPITFLLFWILLVDRFWLRRARWAYLAAHHDLIRGRHHLYGLRNLIFENSPRGHHDQIFQKKACACWVIMSHRGLWNFGTWGR